MNIFFTSLLAPDKALKGPLSMYTSTCPMEAEQSFRNIAIESEVLSNMAKSFMARISPLKEFFAGSFNFTGTPPKEDHNLSSLEAKLCQRVNGSNFVAVSKLPVAVAQGWNCDLHAAKPVLTQILHELTNFNKDVLQPYYVYLSVFLTNKDAKERAKDNTYLYKKLESTRKAAMHDRTTHFTGGAENGTTPLKNLVGRAADLRAAFGDIDHARREFAKIDFTSVKDTITKTTALLDEILAQIGDASIEKMPSEVANNIAHATYEIAQQAEFTSANALIVMNYLGLGPNLVACLQAAEKDGVI